MAGSGFSRWAPLTGTLFVALSVVGLALIANVNTSDSDEKIVARYAKSSTRHQDIIAFFLFLAATFFFVWFLAVLRGRLAQAEGGAGGLTTAAFGAGLVSSAMWMVAYAAFVVPSASIADTSKFRLDPNTYRIINNFGYGVWFSATTISAVTVVATSILALRTGLLPKWIAWLSFVVAATMLVAFFFVPFLIFLGWTLVVSLVLIWRGEKGAPAAGAAQPT
jgi:hypothetical protein